MSTRAQQHVGTVLRRERLTPHLLRLVIGGEGLAGLVSTGLPDEWLGLVVPGQFQSRYYTVRSWDGAELVLDVVVHEVGLVTEWAQRPDGVIGEQVTVTDPKGSVSIPDDAGWVVLVGDLTAMPAMARTAEHALAAGLPVSIHAEVPEKVPGYLPDGADVTWLPQPADHGSALADVVAGLAWPEGPGYFWMAGESAQMRAIRKHLMREVAMASDHYDVMGYWRGGQQRQPRAVDPGPIWRAGKAAGKSDDEIWADYDAARDAQETDR
ncbi:siderophore-interacting protein [Nocardioides bruguierae]|uniref:siderophore-interacting protein n=1 Tax=Nocardioides bruguierae TaxID=2945102 RepID=UPI0020228D38|nr:siderophore-interacting protein [Nocardioides bruguierae]MCL8024663.1 siderophore-interacting protein [Nocardioides bruguierae]